MSTYPGILVVFKDGISDQAAQQLTELLGWLDGVASVERVEGNVDQHLARMQIDSEWRHALLELVKARR